MNLFPKKTPEEKRERRAKELLTLLLSDTDFSFTETERAQIANNFIRLYVQHLEEKKSENISKSIEHSQNAKEIDNVINIIG